MITPSAEQVRTLAPDASAARAGEGLANDRQWSATGQTLVGRPTDTIFVLISDLFEGGVERELIQRVSELLSSGVTVIVLLALSDKGTPSFDHELAAKLAALGAPAFACTPEHFPGLMATAIERRDVARWASEQGIALERPKEA